MLDIFFVRLPFGDLEVNGQLWQEVDEQHFPTEVRRRLGQNGFRVGLLGGQLPVSLSKLMELPDKPAPEGDIEQSKMVGMEAEPQCLRRHLQLRTGRRSEIVTSGVYDELPVLVCESGQLCGQTYAQAQGLLAIKAFPQSDGRVRVELVPELHHGQARHRWVGSQGMWRLQAGRPRRVFDELAISASLAPGSMLMVGSLPERSGSLGHHFFTESEGEPEQKLLVVRLSQTQHDGLLSPPELLRLDE